MILKITGGAPLVGNIKISGAKNSALPLMVCSLLTEEKFDLTNLPDISDVRNLAFLLESMGSQISFSKCRKSASFTCKNLSHTIDPLLAKTIRASMWFLGPMLTRFGISYLPTPGGCPLARKMDLHISVLRAMGATIDLEHDHVIKATAKKGLFGTKFHFEKRSVGATINALMAATLAKGETFLSNCAQEPEVMDLCFALRAMGAQIDGIGTSTIEINGCRSLKGIAHRVIGDRLEAATYAIATGLTKGNTILENIEHDLLSNLYDTFNKIGIKIEKAPQNCLKVSCSEQIIGADIVASPHPNFPTDLQPIFASLMCTAKGTSKILENVHPGSRFLYTKELNAMGANIIVDNNATTAIVAGVDHLKGSNNIKATDLRGGAALLVAALAAKGETIITNAEKIYRGYGGIETNLSNCGAQVQRLDAPKQDY